MYAEIIYWNIGYLDVRVENIDFSQTTNYKFEYQFISYPKKPDTTRDWTEVGSFDKRSKNVFRISSKEDEIVRFRFSIIENQVSRYSNSTVWIIPNEDANDNIHYKESIRQMNGDKGFWTPGNITWVSILGSSAILIPLFLYLFKKKMFFWK